MYNVTRRVCVTVVAVEKP